MTTATRRRLDRVAAVVRPRGCAACRGWCPIVLEDDGGRRDRPERCPTCGRHVPIRCVLRIVGVPIEAI